MVDFDNDIDSNVTASVTGVDGDTYTVEVLKATSFPKKAAELRARSRALIAAGVVNTAVDQVKMGELKRFTNLEEISREREIGGDAFGLTKVMYEVEVTAEP